MDSIWQWGIGLIVNDSEQMWSVAWWRSWSGTSGAARRAPEHRGRPNGLAIDAASGTSGN